MEVTNAGSSRIPVPGEYTSNLKLSILACLVGNVPSVTVVFGLLAVGFSTASRAETVPAVTEASIPQMRVNYPPVYRVPLSGRR
jgi:hypothetical protein